MNDQPIAYTAEGRPLYDNTPTVVAVLVHHMGELLIIRRANDPGKGLLGLPGGYHMRGETWQEAGAREVLEETATVVDLSSFKLISMETDEYGNNLVIASAEYERYTNAAKDGEALEAMWAYGVGEPAEWAFPRHYEAAKRFFEGRF